MTTPALRAAAAGAARAGAGSRGSWARLLVIGVVAGVAYYLLAGAGKTYAVPLVNGENYVTAQTQIKAQHLRSTVVFQNSSSVKPNIVISSNPQEGNNVAANTTVTLFVSKGQAPVAVPNVVGSSRIRPRAPCQSKGFKVGYQDRRDLVRPSRPGDQPEPERRHSRARRHHHHHRVRRSGLRAVGGRGFAADRQPGPDHGRLPGQRAERVGPGAVRQRHGLPAEPAQRTATKGSTVTIFVQTGQSPSAPSTDTARPTVTPSGTPTDGGVLNLSQ